MILCAFALTLLAIAAGTFLLAHFKKENPGNLYKYIAWFIIIMGFLSVLCIGAQCAMRCHRGCHHKMMKECRMGDCDDDDDGCMMGHMGRYGMGCHMMDGCGMMMHSGCGYGMMGDCCHQMGSCCHEGMEGCHENMGSCHEGMGSCNEGSGECHEGKDNGSCPMMGGDMHGMMGKKDSAKKK